MNVEPSWFVTPASTRLSLAPSKGGNFLILLIILFDSYVMNNKSALNTAVKITTLVITICEISHPTMVIRYLYHVIGDHKENIVITKTW